MGRPRKFDTPEEFEAAANEYFMACQLEGKVAHVSGLAAHLDSTRQTLHDYESGTYDTETVKFSDTVKRAKSKCEASKLDLAYSGKANATICIFDLKNNHGWKDKHEQDITTGGKPLVFTKDEENL